MSATISEFTSISLRETHEFGKSCIKSCLLLNGGAAVALLAFAGDDSQGLSVAVAGLPFFVGGLLAAALATGAAYFVQFSTSLTGIQLDHVMVEKDKAEKATLFADVRKRSSKQWFLHRLAIALVTLSLVLFAAGSTMSWRVLASASTIQEHAEPESGG